MKHSDEILQTRWPEIKNEMQKMWSQLTPEELEYTKFNFQELAIIVAKKYGENEYQFRSSFDDILKDVANRKIT